jgi:hypothetical protein
VDAQTPQFRTQLIRALKNAYPGRDFEIRDFRDGLAVTIVTPDGQSIGREAKFLGSRTTELSKSALERQFGIDPSKV